MNGYFWLVALIALCITPVTARLTLDWQGRLQVGFRLWIGGLPVPIPQRQRPAAPKQKSGKGMDWAAAFLHRRKAILRAAHLQIESANVQARLHLGDAAATALGFAFLGTLLQTLSLCAIPRLRGRVEPVFQEGQTVLHADCMFFTRLGNIALAGILLCAEYAGQARCKEDGYAAASH